MSTLRTSKPKGKMSEKWALAHKAYAKKVKTFARNSYYAVPGYTSEDMEQELLEVLWWCVFDYNPDKGACFNTFFQQSARNKISSLIRFHSTKMRKAEMISLDDDDIRLAIESIFLDESAESTVLRRIIVAETIAEIGTSGLRQLIHNEGTGVLMSEGYDAKSA